MAAKKGAVSKSAGLDELKADLKAETLKTFRNTDIKDNFFQ